MMMATEDAAKMPAPRLMPISDDAARLLTLECARRDERCLPKLIRLAAAFDALSRRVFRFARVARCPTVYISRE